jgi:hypothetical protein
MHATCLAWAVCAPNAHAEDPTHVLITRGQDPIAISVVSLDGFTLRYTDEFGMSGLVPLHSLGALIPSQHSAPIGRTGMLLLVDGQRFPGSFSGASDSNDSIEWQHDGFGSLSISLDDLEAIVLDPTSRVPTSLADQDTISLTNGDSLRGFLVDMGDSATLETEDGESVTISSDRIAWVRVANPHQMLEGIVVWLTDGTVTRLIDIQRSGSTSVELIRDASATTTVPLSDLSAIMMRAEDISALANLLPVDQQPIGRPRLLEPIRLASTPESMYDSSLIVPDLVFPAPMQVEWNLPDSGVLLNTTVELPPETSPWGNCELVVLVDGFEVERVHLHEQRPSAHLLVPLRGESFQIRTEPGMYGPIQDTVILRHPVLMND